jgi:hypothetical protein
VALTGRRSRADASHVQLLSDQRRQALAEAGAQRHGAGAFTADWAALLTAIKEKAAKLTQHARGKMDEGSS